MLRASSSIKTQGLISRCSLSISTIRKEVQRQAEAAISGKQDLINCFPKSHGPRLTRHPDKDKRAILRWLEPQFDPKGSDPGTVHIERTKLREPDTCEWMTNCTLWQDWIQGGSSSPDGCRRFLWIHGLPGSGKKILASYLNDQAAVHCGAKGNSFYYCLHEHNQDETVSFLRHIIRDFCFQLGCFVPEDLRKMWQYKRLGVDELKECLRVVTREAYTRLEKRVYIIVDAVDESLAPRNTFLRVLTSIGTDPAFDHVSLLMTSRDYPDIRAAIKKLPSLPSSGLIGARTLPLRSFSSRRATPSAQAVSEILPMLAIPKRGFRGLDVPNLPPPAHRPQNTSESFAPLRRPSPLMSLDHGGFEDGSTSERSTSTVWHAESSASPQCSPTKPNAPTKRQLSGNQEPRSVSPTRLKISRGGSHVEGPKYTSMNPEEAFEEECLDAHRVPACSELSMSNNFVREAIAAVIDKRLEDSGRFGQWPREDFIPRLKYKLAAKAAGIFRAVACYLDLIDRQQHLIDDEKILEAIEKMPDTIFDQYERILVTGIPNIGALNSHSRDFARTALALACSDTAEIPDVDVLVEASRFNVPQGRAQAYNLEKLNHLLGCLVKVSRLRRKPRSLFARKDEAGDFQRLTVAHYTVKEYLYSKKAAEGPASDFALCNETNRRLELKIVFYGLQQFLAERKCPTKYEEYCMKMTEKALGKRPSIVSKDKDIWEAVHPCLGWNDAHQSAVKKNRDTRTAFPNWYKLATAFAEGGAPEHRHTCVVVSLLLLEWPRLAEAYIGSLGEEQKDELWQDRFALRDGAGPGGDAATVLEMCVSARRLDFLDVFVDAGAMFEDAGGIVFRALEDPYRAAAAGAAADDGSTTGRLLRVLLERGADPNPGGRPWTPLQVATRALEPYWVQELLYHGARPGDVGEEHGDDDGDDNGDGAGSTTRKWYHKTPLQICRDTRPRWAQGGCDDDDVNLRWSRARVEQQLTAELRNAGAGAADDMGGGKPEVGRVGVIEVLDD